MEGRFPKLAAPGYADDSPLSFPLRRWVDPPVDFDNLKPVEAYSPGNVCPKNPRPLGKVSASTCRSPQSGDAVGRRRKYANGIATDACMVLSGASGPSKRTFSSVLRDKKPLTAS